MTTTTTTRCESCGRKRCARRDLCRAAHEAGRIAAEAADRLGEDRYRGHLYPEVRALMLEAAERFDAWGTQEGRGAADTWRFRAGVR